MQNMATDGSSRRSLDLWKFAWVVLLVLALASRFYALGDRAVSHDETTHAKFSWNLYKGHGFQHDPMMHGTLLFEASALFYSLFGVSDFSARIYTALTGVAVVMVPLLYRKWLGRWGALVASLMLLISPMITYYSRYTRHDLPLILYSLLLLWAVLRYLDEGRDRWLYAMAAFFPLMYASKENAYIYTAIFLGLLALVFGWQSLRVRWTNAKLLPLFVGLLVVAVALGGVFLLELQGQGTEGRTEEGEAEALAPDPVLPWWTRAALGVAMLAGLAAVMVLYYGVGAERMRSWRLFDVLMVLGTLTLPLGSAFVMKFVAGVDMVAFYEPFRLMQFDQMTTPMLVGFVGSLAALVAASAALGLLWSSRRWPFVAMIHYGIFFVTYTTLFTWGWGFVTGLVGGLAYWMGQQKVERGTQPWYYYGLIGGLYEYFPLLVAAGGGVWAVGRTVFRRRERPTMPDDRIPAVDTTRLLPIFLVAWAGLSWIAYTLAGEKMPWLFSHIAVPSILLAAWGVGQLLQGLPAEDLVRRRGWQLAVSLVLVTMSLRAFWQGWAPFRMALQSRVAGEALTLTLLTPIGQVLGGAGGFLLFSVVLSGAVEALGARRSIRLVLVTVCLVLGLATLHTSVMANFINAELAKEFLVYAHATPDVKQALGRVEEVSWMLTGTPDGVKVAYGKDGAWPFYWYMWSKFPNSYYYDTTPDSEQLLSCPIIIAGRDEWAVVEEIVQNDYTVTDYKFLWWPIEDYRDLTWERIRSALTDPVLRSALWDIFWKRDYTAYAKLKNPEDPFTLKTWPHREDFRLYVRRDLAQQVWAYHLGSPDVASAGTTGTDPFAAGVRQVDADLRIPWTGVGVSGLAVAPDGTVYIADTAGHRIWHMARDGALLNTWGGYGAAAGQFNMPSDVAVDAGGHVYVADTWNHRIQKFDAQGRHLLTWGRYGQVPAEDPWGQGVFLGPQGITIAPDGQVYVADTGNSRIQVFDAEGQFLWEFGGAGSGSGALAEPVGIAVSAGGEVFVADVWNQRVQVFSLIGVYTREWDVPDWQVSTGEASPYVAVARARAGEEIVFVSDAPHQRVLAFSALGAYLWALEDRPTLASPMGVAYEAWTLFVTDPQGGWILGYDVSELQP